MWRMQRRWRLPTGACAFVGTRQGDDEASFVHLCGALPWPTYTAGLGCGQGMHRVRAADVDEEDTMDAAHRRLHVDWGKAGR